MRHFEILLQYQYIFLSHHDQEYTELLFKKYCSISHFFVFILAQCMHKRDIIIEDCHYNYDNNDIKILPPTEDMFCLMCSFTYGALQVPMFIFSFIIYHLFFHSSLAFMIQWTDVSIRDFVSVSSIPYLYPVVWFFLLSGNSLFYHLRRHLIFLETPTFKIIRLQF